MKHIDLNRTQLLKVYEKLYNAEISKNVGDKGQVLSLNLGDIMPNLNIDYSFEVRLCSDDEGTWVEHHAWDIKTFVGGEQVSSNLPTGYEF